MLEKSKAHNLMYWDLKGAETPDSLARWGVELQRPVSRHQRKGPAQGAPNLSFHVFHPFLVDSWQIGYRKVLISNLMYAPLRGHLSSGSRKSTVVASIYPHVLYPLTPPPPQKKNTYLSLMVSDRIIENSKVGKKGRVPTAACFSIINYSCKKWGKISKRHLQHFPLHSKNFL